MKAFYEMGQLVKIDFGVHQKWAQAYGYSKSGCSIWVRCIGDQLSAPISEYLVQQMEVVEPEYPEPIW